MEVKTQSETDLSKQMKLSVYLSWCLSWVLSPSHWAWIKSSPSEALSRLETHLHNKENCWNPHVCSPHFIWPSDAYDSDIQTGTSTMTIMATSLNIITSRTSIISRTSSCETPQLLSEPLHLWTWWMLIGRNQMLNTSLIDQQKCLQRALCYQMW